MKVKTTISFDNNVLKEIDKIAGAKKKDRSAIVNELILLAIRLENADAVEKTYAPMVNRFMNENFKSFENRMAALMAKTSLDSAMSMFLLLDSIARSRKMEPNELYSKTRGMAVKHVQQREELMDMIAKQQVKEANNKDANK